MIYGKQPTLLNVRYIKPSPELDIKESFEVIYLDDHGEVRKSEEPPTAEIYFVKPEFRDFNYNKPQEHISRLNKVEVPVSKIRKAIAEEMGEAGKNFVRDCYQRRDFKALDQLYKWPYAFECDFQPEYYFMKRWYNKYPQVKPKLTKGFLDIEIDQIDHLVDLENLRDTATAPINVATVTLDATNEVWTFMLRPQNPARLGMSNEAYNERNNLYLSQLQQHEEIFKDVKGFINELHERFDPTYGHLDYHVKEYEHEIDLIADIFRLINNRKPNFCEEWNMRFDIQYIYYRIIALGYDPASIMCHPDFKHPQCYFKVDHSTFLIEKQYDYFYCSSYTQFICQMRLYASIRKSQHKLRSVKLNAIAERELGDKKVEYPENTNILAFIYANWRLFAIYNIKDTLLQLGIERKTNDTLTYYIRSHSNLTPYNKIFRETHLLRNVRAKYFIKEGWVQGNNINIIGKDEDSIERQFYAEYDDDDDEESTYKGAINADPKWNMNIGKRILKMRSNSLFCNCADFDMGAFYPSIKIACNLDPSTLLWKASFDNDEFINGYCVNRSLNQKYEERDKYNNLRKLDITGEAVNTYASGNILTFGFNYLNLPSVSDMCQICERELG